jgi:hypothetical protein
MQLKDFERTGDGDYSHYVTRVADVGGEGDFELRLAGPSKVVERMFADTIIDLTIDSTQDGSQVRQLVESTREEHRRSMWELVGFGDIDQLLTPNPKRPDRESSVFASVRPVSGEGTPFVFTSSSFFVPAGFSFYFFGLPVLETAALVVPVSGNQDLFLHLFGITGPVVSSSMLGGTSPDLVWFAFPFFPFVPVFQVFGSAAGVCGNFTANGAP